MVLINPNNKFIQHPAWIKQWFGVNLTGVEERIFNIDVHPFTPNSFLKNEYPHNESYYFNSLHVNQFSLTYFLPHIEYIKQHNKWVNAKLHWMFNPLTHEIWDIFYFNTNDITNIGYDGEIYSESNPVLPGDIKKIQI